MKILCIAFALVSLVYSAPTSQYLIYTPSQFIKLQPQFVQTTSDLRFQDGKQVLYYYPTAPLTAFPTLGTTYYTRPYQVIALKDEGAQQGGFDWQGFFQNWFQGGGQGGSSGAESGAAPAAESGASESMMRFDLEKEMMKMSPEKRKEFEKKFLIVTNTPYFSGLSTLSEASAPVFTLQPLALSERSKETNIVAETILKPKLVEPVVVVEQKVVEPATVVTPVVSVVKQARSLEAQEAPVVVPAEVAAPAPVEPIVAPVVEPIVSSEKKLAPEMLEMMEEKVMEEKKEEMKEEIKEEMKEEMMMKDEMLRSDMMMKEEMKEEMMKEEMKDEMMKEEMMEEKKPMEKMPEGKLSPL